VKAIAILALIFAGLSMFIPLGGVFLALFCSLFALVSFRSQPTISGITFGINIVSTAFLSPLLVAAEMTTSSGVSASSSAYQSSPGSIYLFYVGIHVVLLVVAILWRLIRGPSSS